MVALLGLMIPWEQEARAAPVTRESWPQQASVFSGKWDKRVQSSLTAGTEAAWQAAGGNLGFMGDIAPKQDSPPKTERQS